MSISKLGDKPLNKFAVNDVNNNSIKECKQTSEISNSSLKKVVRGTIIAILGNILVIPISFITKAILARYFTPTEFGIFFLGFSLLNILLVLSLLGLNPGASRQIAFHRGKKNYFQVQGTIISSIKICILSSLILTFIFIFIADFLSINIFHDPALSLPLKIFAVSLPFMTIMSVLISIFLGFERIEEQVYFNILRNILFSLLLLFVVLFAFTFNYTIIAFLVSYIFTLIIFIIYTKKRLPYYLLKKRGNYAIAPIYKELLVFSIPLLSIAIIQTIMNWTDTLMLGMMRTLGEVGLYNAAHPIADFINISMSALLLIFAPIITKLYARGENSEIRRHYYILTKWVNLTSLPLFLIIFLFPQMLLNLLFGSNYASASIALQILAIGWIIANFLGPNGTTLVAIGQTRFLMWACLAASVLNIILNALLIPSMGIIGASIATIISIDLHCIIRQMKVHSILKINPITKNYFKPIIISVTLIIIVWYLVQSYIIISLWMLPLFFIFILIIIGLSIIFTKSLEQDDIMMLLEIEKKIGINLSLIKKLLSKFL